MDTITVLDFAFSVVTTLILGALTVVQYWAEKTRQRSDDEASVRLRAFEDAQFALDIQASTSSADIVALLAKTPLLSHEAEFLKQTHEIALARMDAMDRFKELDLSARKNVERALQRLVNVIGDDPEVQARQADNNKKYGITVQTDRSRYSWDGRGKYSKFEVLHLIAKRFIEKHAITTRHEFDEQFGGVVIGILGSEVGGKKFTPTRLLDALAQDSRYAARDKKLAELLGAIQFDGLDYRAGWGVGFPNFPDMGRAVQVPVIEYFRTQPGYDLQPV